MIKLGRNENEVVNQPPNALFRRKYQLDRWQESETNKSLSINRKPSRVKFDNGTSFLAACGNGDLEEVKRLLLNNVDINTCNVDGLTALHQACIDNDLDLVKFLISHNANIDVRDNEGWTPLHATASCAYMEVARCLLDSGADVAAVNNDGDLPIDLAENSAMENLLDAEMQARHVDADSARNAEEVIMEKDASSWLVNGRYENVVDLKTGASPLHVAAAKGYMRCLTLLLSCPGAEPNCRDADGWTPLHAAAHWGQAACCEALVEANGCLDAKTDANQTVLELAEPDLIPLLTKLRQKQVALKICQQQHQQELSEPVPIDSLSPVPLASSRRRSSVTRISGDQKHTKVAQSLEEERQVLQHVHITENSSDGDLSEDVLIASSLELVNTTAQPNGGASDNIVERRRVPGRSGPGRIGPDGTPCVPLSAPPDNRQFLPQQQRQAMTTSTVADAKLNGDEHVASSNEQVEKKFTKSYSDFKEEYGSRRKMGGVSVTASDTSALNKSASITTSANSGQERLLRRDSANFTSSSSAFNSDNAVQQTSTTLGPSSWRANLRRTGSLQAGSNTDSNSTSFSFKHVLGRQDNSKITSSTAPSITSSTVSSISSLTASSIASSTVSSLVPSTFSSNSQRSELRETLRPELRKEAGDVAAFRRISTIMEPSKAGEAETQRKTAARRARQSRRSTQGVTEDELKEAQLLLHTNTASSSALETSSSTSFAICPDNVEARLSGREIKDASDSTQQTSTTSPVVQTTAMKPFSAPDSHVRGSDSLDLKPVTSDQSDGSSKNIEQEPNWKRIRRERTERFANRTATEFVDAAKELDRNKSAISLQTDDKGEDRIYSLSRSTSEKVRVVGSGRYDAANSNLRSLNRTTLIEETDWKKLYEKEKFENERLCRELELKRLESEERHKSCEKLLAENHKLRDENGSLIRVISKLSKQTN